MKEVSVNTHRTRCLGTGRRQQGAVIVFAAITLGILVTSLALADIGFMYYTQREFQKAADLAAMAGAKGLYGASGVASCAGGAEPAAQATAAQNLGARDYTLSVRCGRWTPSANPRLDTGVDPERYDAVEAVVAGTPPVFLPFITAPLISTRATALVNTPQATLEIRSTVATLEDGIVNALLGALLGGEVALDVVGWQGVANVDVSLLEFLNNVAFLEGIEVSADIGTYEDLLDVEVSLLNIIGAEIEAVGPGSIAGVTLDLFRQRLVDLDLGGVTLPLGRLLNLGLGTETAGLDLALNAFDLVQAVVQVASAEHALATSVGVNLPGVAGIQLGASVVEPPQIGVVGNPALIGNDPRNGEGRIYVRTAQVRLLLSVDLNVVGFLNAVLGALPLIHLQVLDSDLDVGLNVGGAEAYVTAYECAPGGDKALDVDTRTALANLAVGQYDAAARADFFGTGTPFPEAGLLNILELGVGVGPLVLPVAAIGIAANVPVLGSAESLTYATPPPEGLPEIGDPATDAMYQSISTQDLVASLAGTLAGLDLQVKILDSPLLGNLLKGVLDAVATLLLVPLGALLDPIVNALLGILGLDLADAEIGARLSCHRGGAVLVD